VQRGRPQFEVASIRVHPARDANRNNEPRRAFWSDGVLAEDVRLKTVFESGIDGTWGCPGTGHVGLEIMCISLIG